MQINNVQGGANAAVYGVRAKAEASEVQPEKLTGLTKSPVPRMSTYPPKTTSLSDFTGLPRTRTATR